MEIIFNHFSIVNLDYLIYNLCKKVKFNVLMWRFLFLYLDDIIVSNKVVKHIPSKFFYSLPC